MAKKSKKKSHVEVMEEREQETVELEGEREVEVVSEEDEVERPALADLVFGYREADSKYQVAVDEMHQCELQRSRALQNIAVNYGHGPYQIDGKMVTIIGRAKKGVFDADGDQLIFYTFRTVGHNEVITLE